ncbi:DNA excision repair protein ERCC-8 [Planoprotostelium fungivorum]|uniref:DNA excision repair protein ERCC-8 n=1 Tax=Planoprotostelium fungivorum TaxID=1890364 RepID=A0A2P6NK63_9EUKA|nr:DNA excision repair protein ERCC-8 [Planoprotostelium fungivorum]
MLSYLSARSTGLIPPITLSRNEITRLTYSIALSRNTSVRSGHMGPVSLLSAGNDCSVHIYDLEPTTQYETIMTKDGYNLTRRKGKEINPLFSLPRGEGHTYAVSAARWYPHDTGLFFTSSLDCTAKVWDTNALQCVRTFQLNERVYCMSLSPLSSAHSLIAGHRGAIRSVVWNPTDQFILATGSEDRQIRMWDIRKAGCIMNLNQQGKAEGTGRNKKFKLTPQSHKYQNSTISAHDGTVNGLIFTEDGSVLISTGADSRMRCWNAITGEDTLVNYGDVGNNSKHPTQLAVSREGDIVYHPYRSDISCYHIHTGEKVDTLSGHLDSVRACTYHTSKEELYSAGVDENILVWTPADDAGDPAQQTKTIGVKVRTRKSHNREIQEGITSYLCEDKREACEPYLEPPRRRDLTEVDLVSSISDLSGGKFGRYLHLTIDGILGSEIRCPGTATN